MELITVRCDVAALRSFLGLTEAQAAAMVSQLTARKIITVEESPRLPAREQGELGLIGGRAKELTRFSFPTLHDGAWTPTADDCERWAQLYEPLIDIAKEFAAASAWLDDNPARRKTRRGMRAFLGRWLRTSYHNTGSVKRDVRAGSEIN
jgi:hypothetical protein